MKKWAYYNEHDPFAAEWIRKLMLFDMIAPGEVDERSIEDVNPDDVSTFAQCHWFAGIAVWSYALRRAGWSDDREIWTGSCPCQPFSAAGKGDGFADERHLWPAFHHLIEQRRPGVVLGEQVASKDGLAWVDLVHADLEGAGYANGALDLCAAGFGAPHIRQRLYWCGIRDGAVDQSTGGRRSRLGSESEHSVAGQAGQGVVVRLADAGLVAADGVALGDTENVGHERAGPARGRRDGPTDNGADGGLADAGLHEREGREQPAADDDRRGGQGFVEGSEPAPRRAAGGLAEPHDAERGSDLPGGDDSRGQDAGRAQGSGDAGPGGGSRGLDDTAGPRHDGPIEDAEGHSRDQARLRLPGEGCGQDRPDTAGPVNGAWRDADWLFCRDGKWRPVEPGSFPLVNGAAARVGRLRGYGNACAAPVAQGFIEAVMEVLK